MRVGPHDVTTSRRRAGSPMADKKEKRKNTSLRLRAKTLKALKLRAIEEETSVQQLVERLIEAYLAAHKEKRE